MALILCFGSGGLVWRQYRYTQVEFFWFYSHSLSLRRLEIYLSVVGLRVWKGVIQILVAVETLVSNRIVLLLLLALVLTIFFVENLVLLFLDRWQFLDCLIVALSHCLLLWREWMGGIFGDKVEKTDKLDILIPLYYSLWKIFENWYDKLFFDTMSCVSTYLFKIKR